MFTSLLSPWACRTLASLHNKSLPTTSVTKGPAMFARQTRTPYTTKRPVFIFDPSTSIATRHLQGESFGKSFRYESKNRNGPPFDHNALQLDTKSALLNSDKVGTSKHDHLEKQQTTPLRLFSLNMYFGRTFKGTSYDFIFGNGWERADAVADLIHQSQPSVFALQEVHELTYRFIKYHFASEYRLVVEPKAKSRNSFGTLLAVSRSLAVTDHGVERFARFPRGFCFATTFVGGFHVTLVATHLKAFPGETNALKRAKQLKKIQGFAHQKLGHRNTPSALVLLGDLNCSGIASEEFESCGFEGLVLKDVLAEGGLTGHSYDSGRVWDDSPKTKRRMKAWLDHVICITPQQKAGLPYDICADGAEFLGESPIRVEGDKALHVSDHKPVQVDLRLSSRSASESSFAH